MLYVGTGVEAGVPAAVGVGVMVAAELGVGVPAAVGVCVMAATAELLLKFPYPEPAKEKCENSLVKSKIDRKYDVNLDKRTFKHDTCNFLYNHTNQFNQKNSTI